MAHQYDIQFTKTYATKTNAKIAVERYLTERHLTDEALRYSILPDIQKDGSIRYGVLFIGHEAIRHMIHMSFNVIG